MKKFSQTIFSHTISTLHGACTLLATERGICWLGTPGRVLEDGLKHVKRWILIDLVFDGRDHRMIQQTAEQLERYFAGEHVEFSCALDLLGTSFQKSVWQETKNVQHGTTTTYGALANALGNSAASRAVGAALGANPVSVVIPCHRVVGGSGKLTGYAGGLAMKQWLLELEKNK